MCAETEVCVQRVVLWNPAHRTKVSLNIPPQIFGDIVLHTHRAVLHFSPFKKKILHSPLHTLTLYLDNPVKSYSIFSTGETQSILKLQTTGVANSLIIEVLKSGYTTNNWILTDFVYTVSFSLFLFFLISLSPSPSVFLQWPLLSSSLCSTVFILLQPPASV